MSGQHIVRMESSNAQRALELAIEYPRYLKVSVKTVVVYSLLMLTIFRTQLKDLQACGMQEQDLVSN